MRRLWTGWRTRRRARRYQRTRDEASRPDALPDRLPAGESPVRVWRLYRGLAALDLARRAGISKFCLSEIETAGKTGSLALLKRIAAVLGTDLDDPVCAPHARM